MDNNEIKNSEENLIINNIDSPQKNGVNGIVNGGGNDDYRKIRSIQILNSLNRAPVSTNVNDRNIIDFKKFCDIMKYFTNKSPFDLKCECKF